jgi:hypothetical protein
VTEEREDPTLVLFTIVLVTDDGSERGVPLFYELEDET